MEIVDSVAARGVLMSAAPFIAKGTEPIGPTACISQRCHRGSNGALGSLVERVS